MSRSLESSSDTRQAVPHSNPLQQQKRLNNWSDNLANSRKKAELNDNISQLKIFKEMGKVVKAMEDKQLDYLEKLQKAKDDRC